MRNVKLAFFAAIVLFVSCSSGMKEGNIRSVSPASNPAKPTSSEGLAGVWLDSETNDLHAIERNGDGFRVSSVIEQCAEGAVPEKMEMKSSEWENGVLSWSYFVPSTGYSVFFKTVSLDGDNLETEWVNRDSAGVTRSGKETLTRFVGLPKEEAEWQEPSAEDESAGSDY